MSDQIAVPSIEHDVLQIIEEVTAPDPVTVTPDTDLFNSGIIDSFSTIEIIVRLEERFLIGFAIKDLTLQNFSTVAALANTVRRYQKQASAA